MPFFQERAFDKSEVNIFREDWLIKRIVLNAFRKWISHSEDLFSNKQEEDTSLEDHQMKIHIMINVVHTGMVLEMF